MASADSAFPLPTGPRATGPSLVALPYEAMFLASPLAASVSRLRDGRLLAVNDAWVAITGLSREEALGRTTVELGHWGSEDERNRYLSALPRQGHEEHQVRLSLCGDVVHHVRMHSAVLPAQPDDLLMVCFTEVTREHDAQRALQQANLALKRQVQLHGMTEKLARVGYWTNAADPDEVIWSPGLFEIAGLPPRSRMSRLESRSRMHPEDLPTWLSAREAMDGREFEFRWLHPDGQQRRFRARIGRAEVAGHSASDFGVVQDVTAERQALEAEAAQLRFVENITARLPAIVFQSRLHPDGSSTFPYLSQAAGEMLELDPAALQRDGWLLFSRVHPDDQKAMAASLAVSARELSIWRMVFRVRLPRQGDRWYSTEAVPQTEPDGSVLWYGFTFDVTESRRATQALDRQHRMLEAVRKAQAVFIEADDKRDAFEGLLDAFLTVTGSAYGFVGEVLYDLHDEPYLKTHAISDIAWDTASRYFYDSQIGTGIEFHSSDNLLGHAMRTGETVIANEPGADARAGGLPPGHPGMAAFLGVPIAVGDRLVAMVGLASQTGGYSQADVDFLQPLLGTVRQLVLAWRGHAERKRARLQLQATSALLAEKSVALQATFDSMGQGLTMVDVAGRVRFYNQRMLELLDLPESLLANQPGFQEVAAFQIARGDFGDNFELVEAASRTSFVGLQPHLQPPETYLRRTRAGLMLEIHTRMLPEGGMVRTYTDVTPYVEVQEAMSEQRQRLEWVLEATRPGIWETSLETSAMTVNERWAEMLGYTREELEPINRDTWRSLVHPQDLERAQRVLQWHWSGELPYYECDVRMRHKLGHWVWINDRGRVHQRDAQGKALYMSGTHLDINERVAAQEQVRALNASLERRVAERTAELERSMKDMEAISYSIAHDLRAPLRSVNGFAALIAEEEGERLSANARDMFERIARSSRYMGQMITDMLELLRVVRVELAPVPVELNALARSVAEALAPGVPQARIEVQPLPEVMGDATLLRQVLLNLMDNGLKYSRHRERPELVLGHDPQRQAFFLRDNGMGFDMARAQKLFGLFQRLHAGSEVPGTGVGLAIVARIIERHGGSIWAESRPDEGATFWWTLPQTL